MKKIILAVVMLAAVLTGCQTAEKAEDNGWAVKINDKTVSREEFNIYLYETQKSFESLGGEDIWETDFDGRSAETVAKENTLSTLTFVKLTAERAENMEVETTEEDKQAAKAGAEEMYNSLTDTVRESIGADEQLYYDVMLENILYGNVYESTVKDYVVSDDDFEEYYKTYKSDLAEQYRRNVNDSEEINEETLKDYSRAVYEEHMKQIYFSKEYEKWANSAKIERNETVWNSLTLIR